jgi:hypothetical protein
MVILVDQASLTMDSIHVLASHCVRDRGFWGNIYGDMNRL